MFQGCKLSHCYCKVIPEMTFQDVCGRRRSAPSSESPPDALRVAELSGCSWSLKELGTIPSSVSHLM